MYDPLCKKKKKTRVLKCDFGFHGLAAPSKKIVFLLLHCSLTISPFSLYIYIYTVFCEIGSVFAVVVVVVFGHFFF